MRVTSFSLPLSSPLETATGQIETRRGFLVSVDVDGERGVGEATPLPGWTEGISACRATLEEAVDARADPRAVLETIDGEETPAARHGIALAVEDAASRAADEPLYRYLGASEPVERIPVNATVGDGNVVQTRAQVERAVEAGFGTVKVKVGARTFESDAERLWAVREACPAVAIRVDANGAWDTETAESGVRVGGVQRLSYLEQPLPAADLDGLAALRGEGVAIALDESVREHGTQAVIDAEAADVVILKPMVLGGPDRAVAAARRARDAGIAPIVTTTIDGATARAAAVHVAATITDVGACGLATSDRLAADLLTEDPAPVSEGHVSVPQRNGNAPAPARLTDA